MQCQSINHAFSAPQPTQNCHPPSSSSQDLFEFSEHSFNHLASFQGLTKSSSCTGPIPTIQELEAEDAKDDDTFEEHIAPPAGLLLSLSTRACLASSITHTLVAKALQAGCSRRLQAIICFRETFNSLLQQLPCMLYSEPMHPDVCFGSTSGLPTKGCLPAHNS